MQLNSSTASSHLIDQSGYHSLTSLLLIIFLYVLSTKPWVSHLLSFDKSRCCHLSESSLVVFHEKSLIMTLPICVSCQAKSLISRFVMFGFASTSTVTGSHFYFWRNFPRRGLDPLDLFDLLAWFAKRILILLNLPTPFMMRDLSGFICRDYNMASIE